MSVNENPFSVSPSPRVAYRTGGSDIDYIPAADTPAGSVIEFGAGVGVTKLDIKAGDLGALHLGGQWDFPKTAAAINYGDGLVWDPAATAVDGTAGAMVAAGAATPTAYCTQPGGADASAAVVRAGLTGII